MCSGGATTDGSQLFCTEQGNTNSEDMSAVFQLQFMYFVNSTRTKLSEKDGSTPARRRLLLSAIRYGVYLVGAAGGSQFRGLVLHRARLRRLLIVLHGARQHKQRRYRRTTKRATKTRYIAHTPRPCPTLYNPNDYHAQQNRTKNLPSPPIHTCGLIIVLEYKPLATALKVLMLGAVNRAGILAPSP